MLSNDVEPGRFLLPCHPALATKSVSQRRGTEGLRVVHENNDESSRSSFDCVQEDSSLGG